MINDFYVNVFQAAGIQMKYVFCPIFCLFVSFDGGKMKRWFFVFVVDDKRYTKLGQK